MNAPRRALLRVHVGMKAFIVRDGALLIVREAGAPHWWELPGGRIDEGEEALPQEDVLRRELREELGPHFACRIVRPLATWMRIGDGVRRHTTLLVGFECDEAEGAIVLSDEHCAYRWVERDAWPALEFAPGYVEALNRFWSGR